MVRVDISEDGGYLIPEEFVEPLLNFFGLCESGEAVALDLSGILTAEQFEARYGTADEPEIIEVNA